MLREKIVLTKKQSLTQTTVNKLKKFYIAFDVEITGLYPNIHKIIEYLMLKIQKARRCHDGI